MGVAWLVPHLNVKRGKGKLLPHDGCVKSSSRCCQTQQVCCPSTLDGHLKKLVDSFSGGTHHLGTCSLQMYRQRSKNTQNDVRRGLKRPTTKAFVVRSEVAGSYGDTPSTLVTKSEKQPGCHKLPTFATPGFPVASGNSMSCLALSGLLCIYPLPTDGGSSILGQRQKVWYKHTIGRNGR